MIVYNPNDVELRADPYPTYERLREEAPLYHHQDAPHYWALSRHADVSAAWRNFELFSSDHGPALEEWGPGAHKAMSFIAMDPPEHDVLRALVSAGFTRARVERLAPRIAEITRAYLEPALQKGTFDFVQDLASMIPVDVISELIGVPEADRPHLLRLSQQVMEREELDGGRSPVVQQASIGLGHYYYDLVAQRRRQPRDDLASALLEAEVDGRRLDDAQIAAVLVLLGVAGNETTGKLIAIAWRLAWQHPDQREHAFADVEAWVEESLRFEGPQHYTARRVTRDVRLHDQIVPAGSMMLLLTGAANRDERVFPDAGRYRLGRDTSAALAFGVGRHFCLGAALARLQTRIVLAEVSAAIEPNYEVDLDGAAWASSSFLRGHERLPTTVTAKKAR